MPSDTSNQTLLGEVAILIIRVVPDGFVLKINNLFNFQWFLTRDFDGKLNYEPFSAGSQDLKPFISIVWHSVQLYYTCEHNWAPDREKIADFLTNLRLSEKAFESDRLR